MQSAAVGKVAGGGDVTVPDGEGGLSFEGVGEPQDLIESDRTMQGFDVAEDPAGADRGALPVVPDQQDPAVPAGDVGDSGVEFWGRRQPCLVDDHQRLGADAPHPPGPVPLGCGAEFVDEFVDGVGGDAGGGVAEFLRRRRLRRQSDDGAAAVAPGRGEDPHHRRLPRPGRR